MAFPIRARDNPSRKHVLHACNYTSKSVKSLCNLQHENKDLQKLRNNDSSFQNLHFTFQITYYKGLNLEN